MKRLEIHELAELINENIADRPIGKLKLERASRLKLKKSSKKLFTGQGIFDGWAMHDGGRRELQFNIGTEEENGNSLRFGVAFSFATSPSVTDISILADKAERFNFFLGEYPDYFDGLRMWSWVKGQKSPVTRPHAISPELIGQKAFVFIGQAAKFRDIDLDDILDQLDYLYPLYKFVESSKRLVGTTFASDLSAPERKATKKTKAIVKIKAAELVADLRHNKIQDHLANRLRKKFGNSAVETEVDAGFGKRIDIRVKQGKQIVYYEIKTHTSPKHCLREAIGQLLEYSFWPGATQATRLVIVGESKPDAGSLDYLAQLRKRFKLPVEYFTFPVN